MDPEDFPLYGRTVFPDESDAGTYFGVFWRFYLEGTASDPFCTGSDDISDVRVSGAGAWEACTEVILACLVWVYLV